MGTAAKNFSRATKAAGVILAVGKAIVKRFSHQASNQRGSHYQPYIPPYARYTNTWYDTVDASYFRAVNSGYLQGSTASQNSWHQQANWSFLNQRRAFFGL